MTLEQIFYPSQSVASVAVVGTLIYLGLPVLDQPAFDSYVAGVRYYMRSPGMRAAWQVSRGQFGGDFRDFVDAIVREPPTARGGDAYAGWHKLFESERTAPAP